MAFDKVIDSAELDAGLTATAEAIREKTGQTAPIPWEAMKGFATAIAGIQAGGGSGDGLAFDMGEFVLDTDINNSITGSGGGIPHSLGEVPDFVLIWTDDFSDLSAENLSPYSSTSFLGYAWLNGLFGMTQQLASAVSSDYGILISFSLGVNSYRLSAAAPSSLSYMMDAEKLPTAEKFSLVNLGNSSNLWRAGVTYKYFVSKAWWNVGGVANAE